MERIAGSERKKIVVSSSVQKYKIDGFSGEYAGYIESGDVGNIILQFASGILLGFGLALFGYGSYVYICEPIFSYASPVPAMVSGSLMVLISGIVRRLWKPNGAVQFLLENYSFVGEGGEDLSGRVFVEYLGRGRFRLKIIHY